MRNAPFEFPFVRASSGMPVTFLALPSQILLAIRIRAAFMRKTPAFGPAAAVCNLRKGLLRNEHAAVDRDKYRVGSGGTHDAIRSALLVFVTGARL